MKPKFFGAAAMAVCAAATAWAGGPTSIAKAEPNDTVRVDVTAAVPSRCGFKTAPSGMTSAASIETAQSIPFDFVLDCNAPFAIGVKSANGGLAFQGTRDESGFAFEKGYRVGLSMQTSAGDVQAEPCQAAQLTATAASADRCGFFAAAAGEGLSSGEAVAIDQTGRLTVSWTGRASSEPRAAAGSYQDTLIITLGVRS